LAVASSQVFSYTTREGPKNRTVYTPPRRVTDSDLFAAADSSLSAKTLVTVEQTASNKWRMVQEVEGAPASVSEVDTWNQMMLHITHRPGPQPIRVRVVSTVSGTCQGMHARLNGQTTAFEEDEGNNGCANTWTLNASSPAGASTASVATLDVGVFILGGRGTSFGPGKGTITTEIELEDQPTR
jgi:hypothetical protein